MTNQGKAATSELTLDTAAVQGHPEYRKVIDAAADMVFFEHPAVGVSLLFWVLTHNGKEHFSVTRVTPYHYIVEGTGLLTGVTEPTQPFGKADPAIHPILTAGLNTALLVGSGATVLGLFFGFNDLTATAVGVSLCLVMFFGGAAFMQVMTND